MKGNTNSTVEKSKSGGSGPITWEQRGNTVTVHIRGYGVSAGGNQNVTTGLPIPAGTFNGGNLNFLVSEPNGANTCLFFITYQGAMLYNSSYNMTIYGTVTYVTDA